jgi:biopolymer transport protein ExbD
MRIPTTARVGCFLLLAAITGFLGTKYWVESRTLRAVDMPVSLAHGTVTTGTFNINARGFYSILIGEEQAGSPHCNVGLETRRISSIGGLPVYRYQWLDDQSRSAGRETIAGDFLGGFEGDPGNYHLEIEVVSDTGCRDAGKPRPFITASYDDFARWNSRYKNAFSISFVSGSLGLALLIIGIAERFRRHFREANSLDFFESPRFLPNYPLLRRVKVAPYTLFLSQISLLYSQILLLLAISGLLVFHYAWGYDYRSHGLFVLTYLPESSFFKHVPCEQTLTVRVESSGEWYLNSARIEPDKLADALRAQIGARATCIVFFEADQDVPYYKAIHVISLIEQTQGRVVLLTPKTKPIRIP